MVTLGRIFDAGLRVWEVSKTYEKTIVFSYVFETYQTLGTPKSSKVYISRFSFFWEARHGRYITAEPTLWRGTIKVGPFASHNVRPEGH